MTSPSVRRLLFAVMTAVLVFAVVAGPALAEPSEIGRNVGNEIEAWAKALLLGVVGLVAIPVIAKRDVTGGLMLTLLAVVVGGFVFAPETVRRVIATMWQALGG